MTHGKSMDLSWTAGAKRSERSERMERMNRDHIALHFSELLGQRINPALRPIDVGVVPKNILAVMEHYPLQFHASAHIGWTDTKCLLHLLTTTVVPSRDTH